MGINWLGIMGIMSIKFFLFVLDLCVKVFFDGIQFNERRPFQLNFNLKGKYKSLIIDPTFWSNVKFKFSVRSLLNLVGFSAV
jgi:hypothetical protein